MRPPATKRAVLLGAVLLTAAAAGCGSSAKPSRTTTAGQIPGTAMPTTHAGHTTAGLPMNGMTPLVTGADGTSASAAGLTLKPNTATLPTARTGTLTLKVLDARGMPVTQFNRDQTKLMHLIVVRTDFTGYQHVHPALGTGGVFKVPLLLPQPGAYHAIADFTTAGKRYALAVTIHAAGTAVDARLPPTSPTATVDGYQVNIDHGPLNSTSAGRLTFTVRRGGAPVTALQPYLGAFGHLVALRKPDLAYTHVHPTGNNAAAGTIVFDAEFASPATYRLFLQFRAAGTVHTAAFTIPVDR